MKNNEAEVVAHVSRIRMQALFYDSLPAERT
jgi:hypothetical protein